MYSPLVAIWQLITFIITTMVIIMTIVHYYTFLSASTIWTFIGVSYLLWFIATTPFCIAGICFGILYLLFLQLIMRNS